MKRKIKMKDKFTSDDILVALCQKFGNSTEIIDDVIDKKIFMTDKEKEYYLNEAHAAQLDRAVTWDTKIRLSLKLWHGLYVVDGMEIDGVRY